MVPLARASGPGPPPIKRRFPPCHVGSPDSGLTCSRSSFVIYTRVVVTPTAVYAVGVAKRDETFTLHVTSLSPETGEVLASENMPSSIAQATTDFLTLNHIEESTKATTPRIVWLEQGSIKSVALTPTLKAKPVGIKHTAYQKLVDVGLADQGQLVAIKTDGGSRVMKLAEHGASLKTIWEFEGNVRHAILTTWFLSNTV